jgi:serine/threonine/tyrosine-interacting protein
LSLREAFTIVQQRRFCINPNEGFMWQLKEFEPIYKAKKLFQGGQTPSEIVRYKRSYEYDDEDDKMYHST